MNKEEREKQELLEHAQKFASRQKEILVKLMRAFELEEDIFRQQEICRRIDRLLKNQMRFFDVLLDYEVLPLEDFSAEQSPAGWTLVQKIEEKEKIPPGFIPTSFQEQGGGSDYGG